MLLWQMNLTRRSTVVEVLFYVADRYDVEGRQALFKYKWPVLEDESQWMLNASLYVEVPQEIRVDYYSCKDWAEEFLHDRPLEDLAVQFLKSRPELIQHIREELTEKGILHEVRGARLDTGFSKEVARRHY